MESSRNEARYLPTERRLAPRGPRLKLRACFAAPDAPVLGGRWTGFKRRMEVCSAGKLRSDRNSKA
ncbi:hypothetical protein D3C86_1901820 [compost metagenome]